MNVQFLTDQSNSELKRSDYFEYPSSVLTVLNWITYCKQRADCNASLLTISKGYRALRYNTTCGGRRLES